MKLFKISISILCLIAIILCFTGCASLRSENGVIRQIENYYPDAEFVGVEEGYFNLLEYEDDSVYGKIYTFKNDDFEFEVYDYIETKTAKISKEIICSNYYEKVFEFKRDEIDELIEDKHINIIRDESYLSKNYSQYGNYIKVAKFEQIRSYRCIFEVPQPSINNSMFIFKFQIDDEKYIDKYFDFLDDLYDIIEEYIPQKTNKMFVDEIIIRFSATQFLHTSTFMGYAETFYTSERIPFVKNELDFDEMEKNVREKYLSK